MNHPTPDLDRSRLIQMGAIEDPAITQILDSFMDALDQRIDEFTAAAAERESSSLKYLLHKLRGSAGNCGFPAIAELCGRIESEQVEFSQEAFHLVASRAKAAWQEVKREAAD
jgi:HPt (histidine-containing phosphotransfer) domain-containing protein